MEAPQAVSQAPATGPRNEDVSHSEDLIHMYGCFCKRFIENNTLKNIEIAWIQKQKGLLTFV